MSGAARRKLSYTGSCLYSAPSLSRQAGDVAAQRLDELSTSSCVVWYDNCHWKYCLPTPSGANASLNCSVFAFLPPQRELDIFPGYPQLGSLFSKKGEIATSVVQSHHSLLANLDNALNPSLTLRDVRCPLGVKRKGVDSLQWKPLLLSPLLTGTQCDLERISKFVVSLQRKSNRVLPMLINMKNFHSVAKMLYSSIYDVHKLHNVLRYCPMVYGVCHAYKYCCEAVYRKFLSLCTFLSSGQQKPDTDVYTHPKLIWKQRLFMSLLLVAPQYLQQLKQKPCAPQSSPVGNRSVLQQQTEAMFNLLNDYVPSLFILGMVVHDCNWCTGRRFQAPHPAQFLLNMSILVLLRLFDGLEGSHEYLRTLAVAKVLWVPWPGTTPPVHTARNVVRPWSLGLLRTCGNSHPPPKNSRGL